MSRSLSPSRLWRTALAVPAALSLAFAGAFLVAAPAAAAPEDLTVTSPAASETLESRTVVFAGAGTEGSTITVVDALGAAVPGTSPVVVAGGAWTTTATYPESADVAQTATVVQTTAGAEDGAVPVLFELPAPVPPADEFAITSPTEGAVLESRTVTFEGTGTEGATVVLVDAGGVPVPGTTLATVTGGVWTATGTYPDDAPVTQSVTAAQFTGSGETAEQTGEATVGFELPAGVTEPVIPFTVTSPLPGAVLDSRTVTFTGTGTDGSTVELVDIVGAPLPGATPTTVVDGAWTATVTFPEDAEALQVVTATQTTDGVQTGEVPLAFALPVELAPAPTITSPTNGELIVGDRVTFTGTGEPGANVLLLVVPTALLAELEEQLASELGGGLGSGTDARAAAAAEPIEPADPSDPILVDANGAWTVTVALPPEEYTAVAVLIDPETGLPTSEPSTEVQFSLVAAAAVAGPGDGSGADGDGGSGEGLAVTGSDSAGGIGLAAALLLAGVMALASRVFARTASLRRAA